MTKNNETLENRIDEIEKELAELKSVVANRNREPWWRQIVGQFEGNQEYATIARLGSDLRRTDQSE